jgi:hypothetical protein
MYRLAVIVFCPPKRIQEAKPWGRNQVGRDREKYALLLEALGESVEGWPAETHRFLDSVWILIF